MINKMAIRKESKIDEKGCLFWWFGTTKRLK